MKLVAKVKLLTEVTQFRALQNTVKSANAACDWISEQAWKAKEFSTYGIHKLAYHEARERFGLSAQIAARCAAKVADAYKLDQNSKRTFRPTGSIAYDDRILTWHPDKQIISIRAESGRLRIPFAAGARQLELLKLRQGESDLILYKGAFYLAATCNVELPAPADVEEFLGVDFGVTNIAADSDGRRYSGIEIRGVRHRQRRLRAKLQKKHTTSANRRLKKLAGKEQRFATHTNHVISKQIVATAKGTGRGISFEELDGIRIRVRVRHGQRVVLHSWAFLQLKLFVQYKAALAGVLAVQVDPRNSSRECSKCGHVDKANRPSQSRFSCRSCGFTAHADLNAASVLAGRAEGKPATRGSRLSADRPAKLSAFSR